jgi:hypothetical protein
MNILQNSLITQALAPQTVAATSETTGTAIDLQNTTLLGFSEIVFVLTSSSVTDTTGTFVIKESADNSTYGTAIATVTYNQTSAVGTYMISVRTGGPRLRYLRISHTSGSATSRIVGAVAIGVNPVGGINGSTETLRATNAGLLGRAVI